MSTWSEDFAYSLDTLHMPHPADVSAKGVFELIAALAAGVDTSAKGATVVEALTAAGSVELVPIVAAVGAVAASAYVGALIGAALYASAKQGWDAITAPIDLDKLLEWAKEFEAPVLDLPASEEVSWYPEVTTAHETVPDRPDYPGHEIKRGSKDSDSVELIQRNLASLGYTLKIDGIFGGETDRVVRRFQGDRALKVDGIVGPSTWKILFGS